MRNCHVFGACQVQQTLKNPRGCVTFAMCANRAEANNNCRIRSKMRNCHVFDACQVQQTLQNPSESANLLPLQSCAKPANAIESEVKCEIAMCSKRVKSNKHCRIRVKMRICYPREAPQSNYHYISRVIKLFTFVLTAFSRVPVPSRSKTTIIIEKTSAAPRRNTTRG